MSATAKLFLAFTACLVSGCIHVLERDGQDTRAKQISVAEQRQDLQFLKAALISAHVGIDRYEPLTVIEQRFDSLLQTSDEPISRIDFMARIAAFNASIKSGHLYTIASGRLKDEMLALPRLPLYLRILGGRLYVWHDVSSIGSIPAGSELLSINGHSSDEILSKILPRIPSDGFIETSKPHLINNHKSPTYQGFDLYYALHIERPTRFSVRYRDAQTHDEVEVALEGLSHEEKTKRSRERYDDVYSRATPGPSVRFFDEYKTAFLSIPRSFTREGDRDFDEMLRELVDTMARKGSENLIIDVRGNNGGNDDHPSQVFRYLTEQPLRYYWGMFRRTIDFSPFEHYLVPDPNDRPPQWEAQWYKQDEQGRYWSRLDDGPYHLLLPLESQPNPFLGSVYVLANGGSFSSGGQLAALFHDRGRALLIGEETGGDYAGPDGGKTLPILLPASEVHVRIPLVRSLNTFQPWPLGRGVIPRCQISQSVEDAMAGKDVHLELAFELITKGINSETFNAFEWPTQLPVACR